MPRLPTMRVIGSQFISTSLRLPVVVACLGVVAVAMSALLPVAVGRGVVAGGQLMAAVTPLRLLVDGGVGHGPQVANHLAVPADQGRRQNAAGRLVHERHELVGETG